LPSSESSRRRRKRAGRRKISKTKKAANPKEIDPTNESIRSKNSDSAAGAMPTASSRKRRGRDAAFPRYCRKCTPSYCCSNACSREGCVAKCFSRAQSCIRRKNISRVGSKLAKSRGIGKARASSTARQIIRQPSLEASIAIVFVICFATYCALSGGASELVRGLHASLFLPHFQFDNEIVCGNNGYARKFRFDERGHAGECLCFRGWQGEKCDIPYFDEHAATFRTRKDFMLRDFQLSQEGSETTALHHRVLHESHGDSSARGRRSTEDGQTGGASSYSSVSPMTRAGSSSVKAYVRFAVDEEVYV